MKPSTQYCPYCMTPIKDGKICPRCGLTAGNYVPQPHHLRPGTLLMDRYLVGRVLGEGGFGITYIGCDLRLELKVAIKEYLPGEFATRMPEQQALTVYSGEREEQFVQQIISAVEKSMEKALPVFLAGCMAGLSKSDVAVPPAESPATDSDADVDWDFLGE